MAFILWHFSHCMAFQSFYGMPFHDIEPLCYFDSSLNAFAFYRSNILNELQSQTPGNVWLQPDSESWVWLAVQTPDSQSSVWENENEQQIFGNISRSWAFDCTSLRWPTESKFASDTSSQACSSLLTAVSIRAAVFVSPLSGSRRISSPISAIFQMAPAAGELY